MKKIVLIAMLVLQVRFAAAQIVSGSIVGTVRESTGAVIPGARIVVRNQETNLTREIATDSSGSFSFSALQAGIWRVSASKEGFKQAVASDVVLRIDQKERVDFNLELGAVSESVNVQSVAPLLETENPTIGQVFETKSITELPLNGRNFMQLATLSAGVTPATNFSDPSARLGRSGLTVHVAGARGGFNSYLIDGMEQRGSRFGELAILPSVDAVQEFKIQRNFYSAEYGNNVGIISLTIKGGTNAFHGALFEFVRNSEFDARQFFDGDGPSPFRLNQFGGTLGGPVVHDKTFFFGSYEGRRQRRASQQFGTVISPAQLSGDFSGITTPIRDPFNNNAPFVGNRIPANRISVFAQRYNQYIPQPNSNTPQGNLSGEPSSLDDFDQFHARLDHRFSSIDTMFARYSQSDWQVTSSALLPFQGLSFPLNGKNAVIQETHLFGPRVVNTAKLGFSRSFMSSGLIAADTDLASSLGLKNLSVPALDFSLPSLAITGFSTQGFGSNTFRHWTNVYALSDTIGMNRGRHNISFGGDVRVNRAPNLTTNGSNGSFSFTSRFTGNAVADYLLGAFTTASAQLYRSVHDDRFNSYALFVQDDLKVNARLTVNLGLRYEYQQPWRDKSGAEGVFDPSIPGLRLANDPSKFGFNVQAPFLVVGGVREGVYKPQFKNFAPRVGLAYRVTNNTVIRTGYGIFYAISTGNDLTNIAVNPGSVISTSVTNVAGRIPRSADTLFDNPAQTVGSAGTAIQTLDPGYQTPYLQQWTFGIEHEFPAGILVETGYLGSKGTHLPDRIDLNQARLNAPGENTPLAARRPFPQFQGILDFETNEVSNYNALTVRAERRFAKGLSILGNYTWSKSLDTASRSLDDGASPHQVTNNRYLDYGLSGFDVRHRVSASILYELPFGKGGRHFSSAGRLTERLVGGWQVNSIIQVQSGNPFSVFVQGDQSNTGVTASQRPNRIAEGNLPSDQRTPDRWFDTGAFVLNPLNTFGNAGRDTLFQDGVRTVDVSVFKNNVFRERYNLQLRVEGFNVFNNVNFGRPGNTINGARFGVVSSAGRAREIQLALKLVF